eukprot:1916476-Alexandrium_andersonii.AAC.1
MSRPQPSRCVVIVLSEAIAPELEMAISLPAAKVFPSWATSSPRALGRTSACTCAPAGSPTHAHAGRDGTRRA